MDAITGFLEWGYETYMIWSPPVHEVSMYLYGVLFLPMLFFSSLFFMIAFSGLFSSPRTLLPARVARWPRVTIQIPTLNEIVAIRCARKCLELDYPKGRYEIIIGDDSSDPAISREIDSFARKHPGRVMVTRRGSSQGFKAGNLNHMLRHSRGEIIVTFDSDFMPPRDFLRRVIPPFVKNKRLAFAQTKWRYINIKQNIVSRFAATILMVYQNLLASINSHAGVPLLFGSGQAVRKETLVRLGGWKEGSVTEDVEFSVKALKAGYMSRYISEVAVPGEVPFTFRGFFRQQKRWAYGNASTFMSYKRWILFGRNLKFFQRFAITLTLLGYVASPFLVVFMFFGTLGFMTGEPSAINVSRFLGTTGWTVAVNSGFMAAALVALLKEKKTRMLFHVLAGAFTVGLYTAFGVTSGFLRAVTGRRMEWYMIRKAGNESDEAFRPSAVS
jgi:cellulose synthase/poly-beta-1,6-N-acetylglucosamine synthase-like glycosyltransferase